MDMIECRKLLVRKAERFPNPLNHLYAAAGCSNVELTRRPSAGLKLAENDLNCTIAMAGLVLARGDTPEHLAEAERWLRKAILGEQSHPQHLFLTGILHGLRGEALLCQAYHAPGPGPRSELPVHRCRLQAVKPV